MNKVISFCLYGTAKHYRVGAIKNAELCATIYPDWEVWFYVSPTIPADVTDKLYELGCNVIIVEAPDDAFFMNYRFLPCADPEITHAIFRDTDSRVDMREASAVQEWITSGKGLHIMRDHPWHLPHPTNHMLLGGMWGVACSKLRDIASVLQSVRVAHTHGCDQIILTQAVYPRFAGDICVHDDIFDKYPFPTKRVYKQIGGKLLPLHVGCQYDEYDNPLNINHLEVLDNHLIHEGP